MGTHNGFRHRRWLGSGMMVKADLGLDFSKVGTFQPILINRLLCGVPYFWGLFHPISKLVFWGPPCLFLLTTRYRGRPSGQTFFLEVSGHDRTFGDRGSELKWKQKSTLMDFMAPNLQKFQVPNLLGRFSLTYSFYMYLKNVWRFQGF